MSDINEMNAGMRWYVAHTYSGYENKVKANLEKIVENRGMQEMITDVRIPVEIVSEGDGDDAVQSESKVLPAYVLIKMIMCDESWHIVRGIRGVTGFVGPGSKPVPLTDEEVESLLGEDMHVTAKAAFTVGDMVEIIGGIFTGYSGQLSEISADGSEVTVIVSTVGRDMPIKASVNEIRRSAQ
ncbi:MAG: transcription termination/antitermination factor NusG [Clostridiales bacterium]|jgi:transcriptional antiterminator NusG|nr:transcription termination/antitermination factor NusG [Clostridiales bacterium]